MYLDKLHLEVTRNCTLCCEHCLRGDKEVVNMDPELMDYIFKDVREVKQILLTGGEPLIAIQTLEKLADVLESKMIRVGMIELITNGTIYSGRIARVLKRLSLIARLDLRVSADIFHQLELERLGLLEKRNNNVKLMKENFCVNEYGEDNDLFPKRGLIKKGRAVNLTPERLAEINKLVKAKFKVDEIFNSSYPPTHYNWMTDSFIGLISVSVDGKLVCYEQSYDEERQFIEENDIDIRMMGFRDAAIAFTQTRQDLKGNNRVLWF